jgi:hypothetical protein
MLDREKRKLDEDYFEAQATEKRGFLSSFENAPWGQCNGPSILTNRVRSQSKKALIWEAKYCSKLHA